MVRLVWCLAASLIIVTAACGDNRTDRSPDLEVSTTSIDLAAGDTTSITVTGALGDTTFTSSDSTVVTVTAAGSNAALVRAIGVGTATITIKSGIVAAQQIAIIPVTITAAELRTIGVTPPMPTIAHGTTLQLSAIGVYSDSTTQDLTSQVTWTASDLDIATVDDSGVVTAGHAGTVSVVGVLGSISGASTVTVTEATLTSIAVTPANPTIVVGLGQSLTATGTFSDLTTQDLTSMVTWSSDNLAHVTIININQAHGVAPGTANVTATLGAISGSTLVTVNAAVLVSIEVDPATPEIPFGGQRQFTAIGHYDDGLNHDITAAVTWGSDTPATATIDGAGLASAVGPGTTTISATLGAISGSTLLTVDAAVLQSIVVTPAMQSVAKGRTQQYTAMGIYTDSSMHDITTQVTWSATTGASISNAAGSKGLATAMALGMPTITATLGTISGSTTMTVTAAELVSIAVTPITPSAPKNYIVQFTAMGTFSDATVTDLTATVTWSSSDITQADVSNAAGSHGLATTFTTGAPTITATSGAIHGETVLTVTATSLDQIQVTPLNPIITLGQTQQFTATGVFSDATTLDMTTMVSWSSGTVATATISNASGSQGLATSLAMGTSLIEATFGPVMGASNLTVNVVTLQSIEVTPANPSVPSATTQQFTATGHYSDASVQNLTAAVTWSSSSPAVATIAPGGLASNLTPGPTTITATLGAVSGSTVLTVTSAVLVSIDVTPANPSLAKGLTQQFTATGTYSDATTFDLTTQVTWSSSDPTSAQISNVAGSQGLTTAIAVGTPTITATSGLVSGSTTLTVTPAVVVSIAVTPATATVSVASTQAYVATGTFSDATTQNITANVTWTTGAAATATVGATTGIVTGAGVGSTTVTATQPITMIAGSANVNVVGVQVKAFAPGDGAENVKTTTEVGAQFDHPILPASVTVQAANGACTGSFQLSLDDFATCLGLATQTVTGNVVTYQPVAALAADTAYKLKVLGTVTNASGGAMGTDVVQAASWTTSNGGACASPIVISAVYGGGGNSMAIFTNDYVELHNRGSVAQPLAGLSLQYASSTGNMWQVLALPSVSIPAGGYYLVQLASGGGTDTALPTPDLTGTINMSATAGKIALTNGTVLENLATCPLAETLDFVGYGTAASNACFEGTAPTANLSVTLAAIRNNSGCDDTDANNLDFTATTLTAATPPRNSASTPFVCTVCP